MKINFLQKNYGDILRLVVSIIFILLFISLVSATSTQGLYYSLDVYYDNGDIKINNVEVIFSHEELSNIINERYFKTYSLEVVDTNEDKKETVAFGVLNKAFYDSVNDSGEIVSGGLQELDNVSFIVYAPYDDNGKEIIIYDDNGKKISEKEVSILSKIIVEEQGKEDGKEKEDFKVQEVKKDNALDIKKIINYKYWILGVVLVILVMILIYLLQQPVKKRK